MRYVVTQAKVSKQWRWHLIAANGKIIATSGESYHNLTDMLNSMQMVATSFDAELQRNDGSTVPMADLFYADIAIIDAKVKKLMGKATPADQDKNSTEEK
jgi:uncharacterized protein YegP (UPF0339 family)